MDHILTRPARRDRPGILSRLGLYLTTARHRRHLAALNDHLLEDIGISRRMAEEEAARPVWDVPATWRR